MESQDQNSLKVIVIVGILAMLLIISIVFILYMVHRRKIVEKESLIKIMDHEKKAQEALITAIENERKMEIYKAASDAEERQKFRIARDLHDNIGASLSAVIRNIDKNIKDYDKNKFNITRLEADLKIIEDAKDNLRNISHDLIPPNILSYGLLKSLTFHINTIKDIQDSKVDFENKTAFHEESPFSKTDELNIYQICLEIINNLLKHASYKYLKVTVENEANKLLINFTHDGQGITNKQADSIREAGIGLGLNSIFSRALRINAKIDFIVENGSASINLEIPFKL